MFFGKKPEEPISWFEGEDPEMKAAIREAQSTYSTFLAELRADNSRLVPAIEESLVKCAFMVNRSGTEVEHMFVSDLEFNGKVLVGILASQPVNARGVKEGDQIEVDPKLISDWLYVVDGKGFGGYTFQVMWSRFSTEEKATYRDQPPFEWLDLI